MSHFYSPNQQWNWNYSNGVPGDYADAYQPHRGSGQWGPRPGAPFSPQGPPPMHSYPPQQQPGWRGSGGSDYRSSYDEHQQQQQQQQQEKSYPIHPLRYDRESSHASSHHTNSSVPRTPTHESRRSGLDASGGSGSRSGGSAGRHGRQTSGSSPEYMMSGSPKQRERRSQRERERDRELDQDREFFQQRDMKLDQARQRMRSETYYYPRRLKDYLKPIFQNSQAMELAVEVFVKLDDDPHYLSHSAFAMLDSLAAANNANGKNSTGFEDSSSDSEDAEESDLEDGLDTAAESSDSDDSGGDHILSSTVGAGRRRSSGAYGTSSKRNSGSSQAGGANINSFLTCPGFRAYGISKSATGVTDRLMSFLSLTQTVGTSLISMGRKMSAAPGKKELSTKGLLSELLRVLQPRDYRAYFRTAARVILLPDTGATRHLEESALESMEKQLLGSFKFGPGGAALSSGTHPMMACLTYDSSKYGSISLYKVELSSSREGSGWPQRIIPVSAMTGVPKELLRQTARAVAPSHRTVLMMTSDTNSNNNNDNDDDNDNDKNKNKNKKGNDSSYSGGAGGSRCAPRWVSLPAETKAIPGLAYSPNVGNSTLSAAGLRGALGIDESDLRLAPRTIANAVTAPIPAMMAWLHARSAYLTGIELEGIEIQRGKGMGSNGSGSTSDEGRDESKSLVSLKSWIRRIVRWKQGPTQIGHEGRDPCIVVLHPGRGDWVTMPVYWTEPAE